MKTFTHSTFIRSRQISHSLFPSVRHSRKFSFKTKKWKWKSYQDPKKTPWKSVWKKKRNFLGTLEDGEKFSWEKVGGVSIREKIWKVKNGTGRFGTSNCHRCCFALNRARHFKLLTTISSPTRVGICLKRRHFWRMSYKIILWIYEYNFIIDFQWNCG